MTLTTMEQCEPVRIAVLGSGGTGGFFGGLLARAGEDVDFIARGAHLAALRADGLTIRSRLAGDFTLRVRATDRPEEIGPVHLVLFCVKTYDTVAAAESIRPLIGPGTLILPLQNGVDGTQRLRSLVEGAHVLGGAAYVTSSVTEPGVVTQTGGSGRILIEEGSNTNAIPTDELLGTFQRAGIPAEAPPSFETAMWEKFVFICAFGGITALTRLPIGRILASDECRTLFQDVMKEVVTVGEAQGVELPPDSVERALAQAENFEPSAYGSLLHDLEAGRRLEIEALNGTVVRLGRERSLSTPLNFAIYAALRPHASGRSGNSEARGRSREVVRQG